ncbi:MAG: hypothetical protein RLZ20_491 [Actinomycetota bacterium]
MSHIEIRIALVLCLLVTGISPSQAEVRPSGLSIIEAQITKGRAAKTGYTRAQFGQTWADVDRNGCDTRNDILKRDLTGEIFKEKTRQCVVLSGTLIDPFSGENINFVRGNITSMEVQIDHVVALSNAWQTGAFKLTLKERTAFANDPMNLLAVKGRLNSQKSDGDAATWLPPLKSFRCDYVLRQIAVKIKYKLWFTAPEKEAMVRILNTCPEKPLPEN